MFPVQGREWYREDAVGAAIAANGIDRAELFLTSKLHPRDLGQASLFLATRSEGCCCDRQDCIRSPPMQARAGQ